MVIGDLLGHEARQPVGLPHFCQESPADLLALKAPHLSPKIFLLYPIPLESLLHLTGGHDVPGRMKTFASDPDPKNC